MQSPIYKELNKACRNRDCTRVITLGPFAFALGQIIFLSFWKNGKLDQKRLEKSQTKLAYRGLLYDKKDFDEQIMKNTQVPWKIGTI